MRSLTPIILIIVSVAIFFFFIDPQLEEIKALDETILINDEMIELGTKLRADREELQAKYSAIGEGDRDRLKQILPDTVDNVRLLLDIDNIAQESDGISIANIGVAGDNQSSSDTTSSTSVLAGNTSGLEYGTIELSFSVSSSYENFKDFIRKLEDTRRLVDIRDFTVTPESQSEDGAVSVFNFTVTLDTYWLR